MCCLALVLACGSEQRLPPLEDLASAGGAAGAGAGAGGFSGRAGSSSGGAAGGSGTPACATRAECQRLCGAFGADPASCGLGDSEQCGCLCEQRFAAPCPGEVAALAGCIGESPSIDCAVHGRIFPGCEDQSFALEACDFTARGQLCAGAYPACTPFCRQLKLASCSRGPESAAACLCGCEATLVTTCAASFDAFMACTAGAPTFACDGAGRPVAATCDAAWQELAACMAAPAPGSPDAGN